MFARIWSRTKAAFTRWFRREPTPGRFESGSKFSWRGLVGTAPFVWPSRDYLVYVPKGRPLFGRVPLLVWCHGCKQTPEKFAQGTRVTELADRTGCVVLLPRQKDTANPWRCWNWFERRTQRGGGEAAIVAAQIRRVCRRYRIDGERVLAAGISAGGALAAVLGVRYPRLVRAVAVHSGLACGAASSALTALSIMARGPDQDVAAIGTQARMGEAPHDVRVPLLAVHGAGDEIVAPRNAVALVRQFLRLNGHPAAAGGDLTAPPPADAERTDALADGRSVLVREWRRDGRLVARHVEVAGLGHAWSGGDAALPFNDAAPPDATALVGDFFADAVS
ncbi:MAG: PHB depolymerase family esterase [Betaproteobacteria bacterium]|nr:PHB depolymerase family esterase [Betaproteobacteria bacterium]